MRKLLTDLTTGKDNQTFDVARIVMLANALWLVVILVVAVGFYFYGYVIARPFDIQPLFTAVLTYAGGVGALLTSGAGAIYFKRSTEPDGATTETESITRGVPHESG